MNAIRSQLYFSQITAWLASPDEKIRKSFPDNSVVYCLTVPGETYGCTKFASNAQKHNFPLADIGNGIVLKVSLSNLPRSEEIPQIKCSKCNVPMAVAESINVSMLDDRMQTSCTLKGKHRCEDFEDYENCCRMTRLKHMFNKKVNLPRCNPFKLDSNFSQPSTSKNTGCASSSDECLSKTLLNSEKSKIEDETLKTNLELSKQEFTEVLNVLRRSSQAKQKKNDLKNKGDILLDAILRSSKLNEVNSKSEPSYRSYKVCEKTLNATSGIFLERNKRKCVHKSSLGQSGSSMECVSRPCDKISCDKKNDSIISDNSRVSENDIYIDINCDKVKRKKTDCKMRDISNVFSLEYLEKRQKVKVKQKITFDNDEPYDQKSCIEQEDSLEGSETEEKGEKCCKGPQQPYGIPTASDKAKFKKNLDSAASMVFHSRTGLPLTSSPAPVRRGKSCFDFDSSINSVSAIRR